MTQPHLKFLQLNLNHCIAAQDLLQQTVRELSADIALLSEPYRVGESGRWAKAACGKAAIWCCGSNVLVMQDVLSADGFVRARIGRNWVYSCYLAPSLSLERFGSILDSISNDARGRQGLIIGGDFNAWATEWGSTRTDARGRILLEGFANLSISLLNVGTQHTFRRAGTGSVVDLSYASDSIAASAVWSVGVAYSASDHEIVTFSVGRNRHPTARTLPLQKSFKVDAFNPLLFAESLEGLTECPNTNAEEAANLIMSRLDEACVASMAQRGSFSRHHTPVCWWNEAIADARRACLRARRLYQRARHSLNFEALGLDYFRDRVLLYDTAAGPRKHTITGGVPQGSVIGPTLWNVMYDTVLRLDMPTDTRIVGFADDIAIVTVSKDIQQAEENTNAAVFRILEWMEANSLSIAAHKTEAVLITSRKKVETARIEVAGCSITSKPAIKYLGVMMDHRLTFKAHLQYTADKAAKATSAITRLMANVGGPKQRSRWLISTVPGLQIVVPNMRAQDHMRV
ncbi:uncharacterized protein [Drosophila tropicalis]|uniref:uncharacterized protein n=1 Tax=Drosophila tropicalis TaxID=46794 RepID=UPI0035ABA690